VAANAEAVVMEAIDQLVIIAGNGTYPQLLASSARVAGVKRIAAIAFKGETDPQLAQLVDDICWLRVGQLNRMLLTLRDWRIARAIMAGQIAPQNLFNLRPDWRTLLLLTRLKQRNAESIFGAIAVELEKIGVTLLPATTFMESSLAPEGHFAGPKLSRHQRNDVEFGWSIAKQIASLNIGQTVVVKGGTVLAVEAFEGTNETIGRGGSLGGGKALAVKVTKPGQDMRFDVPVIGLQTIRIALESKVQVIAVESRRTLLLEREAVINAAAQGGITLVGCCSSDKGVSATYDG
jgi:UDP-2,3-diacylglucosamine hydrolase